MNIIIDFDGTCVENKYPEMGASIGAEEVLKKLLEKGHKLILFTVRSDLHKPYLTEAIQWFEERNISLWGIQSNPNQKEKTSSPKAMGSMIIDDISLGCPLLYPENGRPFVDWKCVEELLKKQNLI